MSRLAALTTLAALVLLTSTAADAKTRFTPPLGPAFGDFVTCIVQNVGKKPRTVRISLHAGDGVELAAQTYEIAPGRMLAPMSEAVWGAYCAFEGLNRKVRGFAAITRSNETLLMVPAE